MSAFWTAGKYALWRRTAITVALFVALMTVPLSIAVSSRVVLAYTLAMGAQWGILLWIMLRAQRGEMMEVAPLHASHGWLPDVVAGMLSIGGVAMLILLGNSDVAESPRLHAAHTFLSLVAVVLTWMVMNGTFALRYAAIYYAPTPGAPKHPRGGLRFPDDDLVPDYLDFLYYAFTIGMCYQTSDVALCSPEMRRQTLMHGIVAFLYVCGILSMLFGIVGSSL